MRRGWAVAGVGTTRDELGAQSTHGERDGSASVLGEGGGKAPHPEGWGCGSVADAPEEGLSS